MNIVVDTNVLMSAVFFGGVPGRILDAWTAGRLAIVLSPEILDEYSRVGSELGQRYPELGDVFAPILARLTLGAIVVDVPRSDETVCADPDDDKFLMCALAAGSKVVISGDKHLRDVSGWRQIEVLTPRQFCDRHLRRAQG